MTFNRGKSIYFFKKVCNRLLTIIELTSKGNDVSSPPHPCHASTSELPGPLGNFAKPAGLRDGGLSRRREALGFRNSLGMIQGEGGRGGREEEAGARGGWGGGGKSNGKTIGLGGIFSATKKW